MVTNLKNALGSSPGVDVGFRIIFCMIFSDLYQMIGFVISFQAVKIYMKCKYLSNFATVTLLVKT